MRIFISIIAVMLVFSTFSQEPSESEFADYWSKRLLASAPKASQYFVPRSGVIVPEIKSLLIEAYSYHLSGFEDRAQSNYTTIFSATGTYEADWSAFWLGTMLHSSGRINRIRQVFSVRSEPWGRFWLALWQFSNAEYDSSAKLFRELYTGTRGQSIMKLMSGYFRGLSLTRMGVSDSALVVFNSVLTRYPGSILEGEINYRISLILFSRSDWNACRDRLSKALDFYERSARKKAHWWADEALFLIGAVDFMEGRHILAIGQFERLKRKFPDSPYIDRLPYLSILGELEVRPTSAEKDSALISALSPDLYADVLLRLGYLFMNSGEYLAALNNFSQGSQLAEDKILRGECRLFAGECAYKLKKYREASSYYEMVVSTYPERRREGSWGLGWCFLRMKQYNDARLYFASAFSGYDDDFSEHARLIYAETYLTEGKYSRAATELNDFLKTCKGNVCDDALFNLVLAYDGIGDTIRLANTCREFLKKYRRDKRADFVVNKLANVLFIRGHYQEVIALADEVDIYAVTRETADKVRFLGERARFYTGDYKTQIEISEKFIEKFPDSPLLGEVLLEIGDYLCSIGDYSKGAQTFDKLRQQNIPDSLWVESSYRMGICHLAMGDTLSAIRIFNQLINEPRLSGFAVSSLGMIALGDRYLASGNVEKAVKSYNEVLAKASDSTIVATAELRLAFCFEKLNRYEEARNLYRYNLNKNYIKIEQKRQALLGILRMENRMGNYEAGFVLAKSYYDTVYQDSFKCLLGEEMGRLAVNLRDRVDDAYALLMPDPSLGSRCKKSRDVDAIYDLSLALEYRQRIEEAKKVWNWLIEISNDDNIVSFARDKLKKYNNYNKNSTSPK